MLSLYSPVSTNAGPLFIPPVSGQFKHSWSSVKSLAGKLTTLYTLKGQDVARAMQ